MSVDQNGRPASARKRLLDAANELFYEEGVHTVGVDRVIERAGVAKATLYTVFGNKDGLVRAYLLGRHDRTRERMTASLPPDTTPLGSVFSECSTFKVCRLPSRASVDAPSSAPVLE